MLNELSIGSLSSIQETKTAIETFVLASVKASKAGFRDLRIYEHSHTSLYSLPFREDYSMDIWLKDPTVNKDLQLRFREIITSTPLIKAEEIEEFDIYGRSEFKHKFNGDLHNVYGLGAAYLYETLCLSFISNEHWNKGKLEVSHYQLGEDGNDDTNSEREIKHFYDSDSFSDHLNWLQKTQADSLTKSSFLWNKRGEFYPYLTFCAEVESQLNKIGASKILLQIFDRLAALNSYLANWTSGDFNYSDLNQKTNLRVSLESKTTLDKFGTLRKFKLPDGRKEIFSLHIKTGNLRFHFFADNLDRRIYIGYIGPHLRISSEG